MRLRNYTLDQHLARTKRAVARDLATWLERRFTQEITTAKWAYPTPPQTRDIVASGRLLRSQTVNVRADGQIEASWPVPYSTQIHEGGVTPWGMRFPGRPWTRQPMTEAPAQFMRLLRSRLEARP
jgi:hypothetical protein